MTTTDCKHDADPIIYRSGGQHFTAGDPWDDIVEHVICSLCGEHMDCEAGCREMKISFASHPRCATCGSWHKPEVAAKDYGFCFELNTYRKKNFYCSAHTDLRKGNENP